MFELTPTAHHIIIKFIKTYKVIHHLLRQISKMATPSIFSERYSIESCLGSGGFGVVLKATDNLQKVTAIKFLFPTYGSKDASQQKQILRETSAKELRHANVVQTINFETKSFQYKELEQIYQVLPQELDDYKDLFLVRAKRIGEMEMICIQMELCGENLRNWLDQVNDKNDPNVQNMQMIISDNIIIGLKFLHDHKIIHRDLKPANILFSSSNYTLPVKIGDFGLCRKIHSEETITHSMTSNVGTENYMAPEVRAGKDYSYQADIYSLGLIIWEVVQLIPHKDKIFLFEALTIEKRNGVVKPHASLPWIKKLIINLTKRKVEQRFKNMNDVMEVWKNNNPTLTAVFLNAKLPSSQNGRRGSCYDGVDSIYISTCTRGTISTQVFSVSTQKLTDIGTLPFDFTRMMEWSSNKENGGHRSIFFFGIGDNENEVHKFDNQTKELSRVAQLPYDVDASFKASDSSKTVYILGGNKLLAFDMETLTSSVVLQELPFSTNKTTSVRVGNKAFIYGASGSKGVNTLIELNLETFTLTPVGDPNQPYIIYSPSSVYDGVKFIYLFGGYEPTSEFPTNGMIRFDTVTLKSRFIPVKNFPVGEEKNKALRLFYKAPICFFIAPACVYVKKLNRIYCFGGKAHSKK